MAGLFTKLPAFTSVYASSCKAEVFLLQTFYLCSIHVIYLDKVPKHNKYQTILLNGNVKRPKSEQLTSLM